jgi:hypothetical protein
MPTFCVVTPTVPGRKELLARAIESVRQQTFGDYVHVVCGDGCDPEAAPGPRLALERTQERHGGWGQGPRNHVIDKYADACKYFVFLDDDNMLLPHCLAAVARLAGPPLLAWKVLYSYSGGQMVIPPSRAEIDFAKLDTLCFAVASATAKRVRWKPIYAQDIQFFHDCLLAEAVAAGVPIEGWWRSLLAREDLLGFVDEVLGCYYGKGHEGAKPPASFKKGERNDET